MSFFFSIFLPLHRRNFDFFDFDGITFSSVDSSVSSCWVPIELNVLRTNWSFGIDVFFISDMLTFCSAGPWYFPDLRNLHFPIFFFVTYVARFVFFFSCFRKWNFDNSPCVKSSADDDACGQKQKHYKGANRDECLVWHPAENRARKFVLHQVGSPIRWPYYCEFLFFSAVFGSIKGLMTSRKITFHQNGVGDPFEA